MSISFFRCPVCGQFFEAAAPSHEDKVRCPKCGQAQTAGAEPPQGPGLARGAIPQACALGGKG